MSMTDTFISWYCHFSTNAQLLNRSFGVTSSPKRRSVATYYTPFDDACTGSSSRESQLIVAISSHLYGDSRRRSKYCGHCVRIHGPKGHVVAKVMDACPSCSPFSLDLSPMAFAMIGELNDGRVGIQWSWTICPSDEDFSSNDTDLDTSYTNDIADLQVKLVRHYYLHALQAEIAYALMRQALREMQQSDNPSSYPLEIDGNVGDDQDRLGQVVLK
ncbi:hypothetical protein BDF22DRAFT_739075 [Syncephalis plumigaleata]|nr:hypothetical protein BDF22DRAFT_739075 [Syncephalis plumigaleata]